MKKHLLLTLLLGLLLGSCGSNESEDSTPTNSNGNSTTQHPEYGRLEFPHIRTDGDNLVLIHRVGSEVNFCTEWSISKKSLRWSCYQLYKSNMASNTKRRNYRDYDGDLYPYDPELPSEYYFDHDPFKGTGYDHGHICPSADRLSSELANDQTFYLTNMMPQVNGFNAGVWATMEAAVRNIAKRNNYGFCDTLYVCKGGTIDSSDKIATTLGSGLIVPKYFFMALLAVKDGNYHAFGFWIEHKASSDDSLAKYAVTINELEQKTGIDFFCNLPDGREDTIESVAVNTTYWGLE